MPTSASWSKRTYVPSDGRPPVRHPPQPEQPEHVVDPDTAGMAQHGAQHVAVRRVADLGQPVRPPRRLRPVLALLVERVGRRADRDAAGHHVLQRPGVGAVADGPRQRGRARPRATCPPPARGRARPPAARRRPTAASRRSRPGRRAPCAVRATDGRPRVLQRVGPLRPHRTVHLGERAPRREVAQPPALALEERVVVGLPAGAARHRVHHGQRGPLGLPDRVAVDQHVGGVARRAARAPSARSRCGPAR